MHSGSEEDDFVTDERITGTICVGKVEIITIDIYIKCTWAVTTTMTTTNGFSKSPCLFVSKHSSLSLDPQDWPFLGSNLQH